MRFLCRSETVFPFEGSAECFVSGEYMSKKNMKEWSTEGKSMKAPSF